MANLFDDLPDDMPGELIEVLARSDKTRVERIVSTGQQSAPDFWYDQDENEWVIVLKGKARLQFEEEEVSLDPGDYVFIPAHRRHRVSWTSPDEPTVWLAVFFG